MRKNIISIMLILALLAGFASCKKIDGVYIEEETTNSFADNASGEEATVSPELEEFLNSFDTSDPEEIEKQFEQMLESEPVDVELEFGDELIDDSNSTKVEVDLKEDGKPDHGDLKDDYFDIISGETFTLDLVISQKTGEEEMEASVMATRDGEKLYMEMALPYEDKGTMKIGVLNTGNGDLYFILPAMRAYMLMTKEELGDIPFGEMLEEELSSGEVTSTYIESREVVYNGKTYMCDVYEDGDVTTKCYYNDKELKRIETVDADNNTTILEINTMSDKADNSKFKAPKGYLDLTPMLTSGEALSGMVS